MYTTHLATPEEVAEHWHLVKDHLKRALEHGVGESKLSDYLAKIMNYQAQLWVVLDEGKHVVAACLTKFIQYSTHKTLHIVAVGGDGFYDWYEQIKMVEQFALDNGCVALEQWGRPGWSKVLPKMVPGFETVYHVMRKELNRSTNVQTED